MAATRHLVALDPEMVRATDPGLQAQIAAVREAGLNMMMSMKGDGKPVSFIEGCAVDLDDLADYTDATRTARPAGTRSAT